MTLHTVIAERQIEVGTVAGYLAGAAGAERAVELVHTACAARGYDPRSLSVAQAMDVFEEIASQPGLVGIAARFARSRMILDQTGRR